MKSVVDFFETWLILIITSVSMSLFVTVGIDYISGFEVTAWALHRAMAFIVGCVVSIVYLLDNTITEDEE